MQRERLWLRRRVESDEGKKNMTQLAYAQPALLRKREGERGWLWERERVWL